MKHCLLHSISCSRSRHIFTCSMLAVWFSLTIFCFSRNFWSPHRTRRMSKLLKNYNHETGHCLEPDWPNMRNKHTLLSNWFSCSFLLFSDIQRIKGIFPHIDPWLLPGESTLLTLPSNSCSEMLFMYTSL